MIVIMYEAVFEGDNMENKTVKLSGPVFMSPTNILYRMKVSQNDYVFPRVTNEKNMVEEKNTGYVLKRKKR